MLARTRALIWLPLGLAMLIAAGSAQAQNYDGNGVLRFGLFGQGSFIDLGVTQPGSATVDISSAAVGLSFGYDFKSQHSIVFGAEIDGSFGKGSGTVFGTSYGFDYLVTARGRLGFEAHPGLLIYTTVGLALLGFEAQPVVGGLKSYETPVGWTVGGGIEWEWYNTLLFTEYLYSSVGSSEFSINGVGHRVEGDIHLMRFGIKFKTGHDYHYRGPVAAYAPLK